MKKNQPKGKIYRLYDYFKLNRQGGKTNIKFMSYTDIAIEYGVGKGVVAGKFYRSNNNTIKINKDVIKREVRGKFVK